MKKKTIFIMLIFTLLFNFSVPTALAIENTEEKNITHIESVDSHNEVFDEIKTNKDIKVFEDGIEIDGVFYEGQELDNIINNMEFISSSVNEKELGNYNESTPTTRSAFTRTFIPAGTYFIAGIGRVVVQNGSKIILAGVAVVKGSTLWNKIVKKIQEIRRNNKPNVTKNSWNNSCERATNKCDKNKQYHILQKKHNWNKFNKNPKWSNVAPLIIKTLKDGSERHERANIYVRTLVVNGKSISVRFIKDGNKLVNYISTAWVK